MIMPSLIQPLGGVWQPFFLFFSCLGVISKVIETSFWRQSIKAEIPTLSSSYYTTCYNMLVCFKAEALQMTQPARAVLGNVLFALKTTMRNLFV